MFTETVAEFDKIMRRLEIFSSTMEQTKPLGCLLHREENNLFFLNDLWNQDPKSVS